MKRQEPKSVINFTQKWVENVPAPPAGKQADYYDTKTLGKGRRFGLRVSYRGTKCWGIFYQHQGRTRRLSVGHWPPLSLADARREADKQLTAILLQQDPAAERHGPTVDQLARLYIEKHAKRHKRSWKRDQEIIDRDVLPHWGRRKVRDIKRRHVCELTDRVVDRKAPIAANRLFSLLSKLFSFAVERDLLEHNPCNGAKKPTKETARDRALVKNEIKTFWHGLALTNISEPLQLCLKLLLVTGQRKGELSQATKAEVNLDGAEWLIPKERAKNSKQHFVPLSPLAVSLFTAAFELSGESTFVFPSPTANDRPILPSTVNNTVKRNLEKIGLEPWTPHDLRRSCSTGMAELAIPREVRDKVFNHAEQGIDPIYTRYDFADEKRAALNKWGRQVEAIVSGETAAVIALR
ncbi:MAG: tyrosine-type recombinase/integrase [Gammaproteobacteria bacterium]|nr:tyrosine-type recombinase/integrase [Gammaproteobacteria bacterium]